MGTRMSGCVHSAKACAIRTRLLLSCWLHEVTTGDWPRAAVCACECPTHPLSPFPGLITDSFGKLRNKEEALKEDMQV